MNLATRVSLVQNLLTTEELPVSVAAELAGISRSSVYYRPSGPSDEELCQHSHLSSGVGCLI